MGLHVRGTRWDPPTPTAAHPAPPPPRCIKPNDTKTAMLFTPDLVLAQVRYLGLMENVRVRRAGYAFRQLYQPFLERYKMLSRKTWPRWTGGDRSGGEGGGVGWRPISQPHCCGAQSFSSPTCCREGAEVLLAELKFPPEELAYGHTKIFIRSPRTVSVELGGPGCKGGGVSPTLSPPSPCSEPSVPSGVPG